MVEVWTSEALYSSWLNTSVILLTGSLVFYHMTRLKEPTLKISPVLAAILVSFIIITDVCIGLAALIPYIVRTNRISQSISQKDKGEEKSIRVVYIMVGCSLILIELCVCILIVRDAIRRSPR
jgi:uncharacterized membrane protein YidH (DUF202 family)